MPLVCSAISDYQPLVLTPLVFPAGSKPGDTQNFSVEIVDDAEVEGGEQFSLTISDSSETAQPVQSMATIAIIDNDFGRYIPIWDTASSISCSGLQK